VDSINYIRRSLEHYFYEPQVLQITPWTFVSSNPRSSARGRREAGIGRPCSGEGGVTGGEVRGEGKSQELTVVRLHHVSRIGVTGKGDFDGSPKWWWRGQRRRRCSGGQHRRRTCTQAPVSRGKGIGVVNWEHTLRIRGDRRRQRRWRRR
jgi:hypothetical protein